MFSSHAADMQLGGVRARGVDGRFQGRDPQVRRLTASCDTPTTSCLTECEEERLVGGYTEHCTYPTESGAGLHNPAAGNMARTRDAYSSGGQAPRALAAGHACALTPCEAVNE